jgi:RNA polymerase sigma-70 factor (ECF subfamily)
MFQFLTIDASSSLATFDDRRRAADVDFLDKPLTRAASRQARETNGCKFPMPLARVRMDRAHPGQSGGSSKLESGKLGPMSDREQRERIAQAIAGSRPALERLLLDHYTPLAQHLQPRIPASMQSVIAVDDILQETFSQVFEGIRTFTPKTDKSFGAWLKAIAENRLRDAIKAQKRKKRGGGQTRVQPPASPDQGSVASLAEMLSAGSSTPSQALARKEAVRAAQVAIAGLPEDYREAVRLRFLEGRSVDSVAAEMHRSPGAVRGLIDRAKRAMRETLGRASHYFSSR